MLWILRWLISREYRLNRKTVLYQRKVMSIPERRLFHAIFSGTHKYIHCHCGAYADKTRLCSKHRVVLSLF
jgi:hypothetical protein